MKKMRIAIVTAVLGFVLLTGAAHGSDGRTPDGTPYTEGEWVSLFNGRNLEGWTPKFVGHEAGVNLNNTYRVEDGLLKVDYSRWDDEFQRRFGHLFYKDEFSHYRLRVEYRFVGEQTPGGPGWAFRNSGIMFHGQRPDEMEIDQDFPDSIEAQLLGGNGEDERTTMNVCSPGTHIVMDGELVTRHCNSSSSETYHGGQWVTAELEVRGSEVVRHYVEGEQVLEYTEPQLDSGELLESGTISLQAESHPVHFRTVEIMVLEE